MKHTSTVKVFCLFILALSFFGNSYSQSINVPVDSIPSMLCKKWEANYAMMGGMNIGKIPGATEISYEFNKDKTFVITSKDPKDKTKGAWGYDPKSKSIKLTVNGKSNTRIISLKEGELVMLADTKEATPDDPMEIKIVYKQKTK